jgi:signal transduction histidine kinase
VTTENRDAAEDDAVTSELSCLDEDGVVEAYTVPAVAFCVEEETATVVAVNTAFAATGGASEPGTAVDRSLAGVLDARLADADGAAVADRLRTDGRVDRTVQFAVDNGADGRYLPRVVREETDECGHLLFVGLPSDGDLGELLAEESTAEETASATGTTAEETTSATETPATDSSADQSEAVAHVVSHDLRNPLDVAKAHLRLSRDVHPEDEHLQRVEQAHGRMEQIIQDVLTLARGERAISPSAGVEMDAVVRDAWESVATDDVTFEVSAMPTATADRPRVERLVENLLRNAVDHAGPDPTVRVGGLTDGDGFYIADDGDGVPPADREAVFEPGYSASGDGTGLGLAIVRRIAAAHGWSVAIEDSWAGGARVEVRFDGGEDAGDSNGEGETDVNSAAADDDSSESGTGNTDSTADTSEP